MNLTNIMNQSNQSDWKDWKWQQRNSIIVNEELSDYFVNIPKRFFKEKSTDRLNLRITPYMLSKINPEMQVDDIEKDPWFQQFFSIGQVYEKGYDAFDGTENWDLKGEFPTPILQHKYPNCVLLYAPNCLAYCNFCFKANEQLDTTKEKERIWRGDAWQKTLEYIGKKPGIEELVFSGGDPFALSDKKIDAIYADLSEIRNLDGEEKVFLKRIHTRALTQNPYRITPELVQILKKHNINQLIFNVAHPSEITLEFKEAVYRIKEGMGGQGIMLGIHTPFLNGVNNDKNILWKLFSEAGKLSIKSYYILATFPHTPFADQQRVPVNDMINIMDELRREKSPAYLPIPIIAHPQRKIILPYYSIEQTTNPNGVPFIHATELYGTSRATFNYADAKK